MNLSYWEYKTWLSHIDFTVIGSGIVGLNCALNLRKRFPKAKILVLEKGILPQGASTKNAGFACFGSISEILSDLKEHSPEDVISLVKKRWDGIQLLRNNLGDSEMDFQNHGGHELFLEHHEELYQHCLANMEEVNLMLQSVFGKKAFNTHPNTFRFKGIQHNYVTNSFESQIDTGKMMVSLLNKVRNNDIGVLNAINVETYCEIDGQVAIKTDKFEFKSGKLFIATNGFASKWLGKKVKPARAQVLITKPIENLHIKGTFHLDQGYYYFRNIHNRILFGGGRNLDFKGEETTEFKETEKIQNQLERLLEQVILPDMAFEIDQRWSGIMGIGQQKKPIVRQMSDNTFCGVRMGGMGVAIGSLVGKELADLL
ncbi:NAD(P)/FAD-dependent oxidoreductase [Spongiimicrobium sp. 3-5]|uniref:NAD(P)/FAD-dependent oxidoreductase n=1 Tax=Spongiimicrobium sp. 3-5 TaxID=3332596 RepID=UPI00397F4716